MARKSSGAKIKVSARKRPKLSSNRGGILNHRIAVIINKDKAKEKKNG